jgi:hypothetical protein
MTLFQQIKEATSFTTLKASLLDEAKRLSNAAVNPTRRQEYSRVPGASPYVNILFPTFHTLTLQWDYAPEWTDKAAEALRWIREDEGKFTDIYNIEYDELPRFEITDRPNVLDMDSLHGVIRDLFQTDVLEGRLLETLLEAARKTNLDSLDIDDWFEHRESSVVRLMERREDLIVILMIEPRQMTMKIGLSNTDEQRRRNNNKLVDLMYAHFGYFNQKRAVEKHELTFLDRKGYEYGPMNCSNPQRFHILCGIYIPSDTQMKRLKKNQRYQNYYMKRILPWMLFYCGPDTKHRTDIDPRVDIQTLEFDGLVGRVNTNQMVRTFSCPFADYRISGLLTEITPYDLIPTVDCLTIPFDPEWKDRGYYNEHGILEDLTK